MKRNFEHLFHKPRPEPAVIIGNGPSLRDVPIEFLDKHVTFGSNRGWLRYLPTYYAVVNPLVVSQWHREIDHLPTTKFAPDWCDIESAFELRSRPSPMFSYDPTQYIYEGYTVTFVLMQLAFFMGYHKLLLVGVDHRYIYQGNPNEERFLEGDDPNHFDPNYFRDSHWHNPDLNRSAEAYGLALEAFGRVGGSIINLTSNTALDVFPKEDLRDYL